MRRAVVRPQTWRFRAIVRFPAPVCLSHRLELLSLSAAGFESTPTDRIVHLSAVPRPAALAATAFLGTLASVVATCDATLSSDRSEPALDTSGFKNNLRPGHFKTKSTPSNITIHFSPVPEPAAMVLRTFAAVFTMRRRCLR
jgi:hypothetical protein